MRCTKCGTESTTGRKFCPECGSALSNRCPKCGADNSPSAKFCEDCGVALAVVVAAKTADDRQIRVADTPASENLEGERKTVTALFADIKGSTELEQDLDPRKRARSSILRSSCGCAAHPTTGSRGTCAESWLESLDQSWVDHRPAETSSASRLESRADANGAPSPLDHGDRVDKRWEDSIQQNQYQPIEVAQPYPRWRLAG